ncbi:sulfite exporter TauE/SafE family protein [Pelagovum pacificum]|uniref:Probable membrane transporter protein n=1 Tax=Pelagovum pacificum TaxID=2588711 RepID=A0A5C5GC38_9RHOB|nr:sulfite exporter TauE/SafE family protein [Pelagovum pacificum]QQA42447.1 sulfite exporter TauE/SafE family protein [Pelagovum pacificum]TNY31530.1 sulfite exporter TauE/SafE family protein [Pelagovum pacificum]
MTFDLFFFAIAVPAVLFAAVSKAGFGSGAAFAGAAILAVALPPGFALGMMLPLLMLVDVASLGAYRGQWHKPSALWLIAGAVPGIALGAWLYVVVEPDVFRLFLGLMCILFVAYQYAQKQGWLKAGHSAFSRAWGAIAGVVAGFTSFVSHAGGPPVAVFLLNQGMGKTTFQATTVIVFWAINLLKAVPYAFIGIFTADSLLASLMLAPVALIGAWIGVRAHHWMPEKLFFGLTYVLLTLTGLRLIWDGIS